MAEKTSEKTVAKTAEKAVEKSKGSGIIAWLSSVLKNVLIASLVFIVMVFILGEAYALYAMRTGNALVLWLPVFILIAILFYKVID